MYHFASRVRFSEVDHDFKLSISAIVNYFQDTSTFQSESLGIGISYLKDLNCAWILTYWHIEIHRQPLLGEEIIITTWPYEFKGFVASRNFLIKTKEGEVLVNANSMWAYVDMAKQRMKKVDREQLLRYELSPPYNMVKTSRKIAIPEQLTFCDSFSVTKEMLDLYAHVNNEKYIRMAQQYIPESFKLNHVRTEYKNQAVLNDVIYPKVSITDKECVVVLDSEAGKPYAVVSFS